jgi:hypothetical protein
LEALPERAFVEHMLAQLGERVVHVDRAPPRFRFIDPAAPQQERATLMFQPRSVDGYAGLCSVTFLIVRYDETSARHGARPAMTPTDFERVVRYRTVGDVRSLPIDALQDDATQAACTKIASPDDLLVADGLDAARTATTLAQAIRDTWKRDRAKTPVDCQVTGDCAAMLDGLTPSQIDWTTHCEAAGGQQPALNQGCATWTLRNTKDHSGMKIRFDVLATPQWAPNGGSFRWRLDRIIVSRPLPPLQ